MKNRLLSLLFSLFAITVAIGGVIGYIKANSLISLAMSGIFSAIIMLGSILLFKRNFYGYYLTFGAAIALNIVFFIRYLKTEAIFPGVMSIYCSLVLMAGYYLLKGQPVNIK